MRIISGQLLVFFFGQATVALLLTVTGVRLQVVATSRFPKCLIHTRWASEWRAEGAKLCFAHSARQGLDGEWVGGGSRINRGYFAVTWDHVEAFVSLHGLIRWRMGGKAHSSGKAPDAIKAARHSCRI